MGPRSVERGRSAQVCSSGTVDRLQWGRALLSAEGLPDAGHGVYPMPASMGPRSVERGRETGRALTQTTL